MNHLFRSNSSERRALRGMVATSLVVAIAAGCSSLPPRNGELDRASAAYRSAQSSATVVALAPVELKEAGDALALASGAWERNGDPAETRHLAYLAQQRVSIAEESAAQRQSERAVGEAASTRDAIRLRARTAEVDQARASAETAQAQAAAAQRRTDAADQQARSSEQQARNSEQQARNAEQQARSAEQQAADAQARNAQLNTQLVSMLNELNAKQTDRGLVITLGDVLFDTAQADIRANGLRSMDKLSAFLAQYPQRRVLIEGYTDSVGSDAANLTLSTRRAESVRTALQSRGVAFARISTVGHGEAYPLASNDAAQGRQMNRRVEILLSDDDGVVKSR